MIIKPGTVFRVKQGNNYVYCYLGRVVCKGKHYRLLWNRNLKQYEYVDNDFLNGIPFVLLSTEFHIIYKATNLLLHLPTDKFAKALCNLSLNERYGYLKSIVPIQTMIPVENERLLEIKLKALQERYS